MLIGAHDLDKEKEAIEEILTQEFQNYLKFNDHSRGDPTQALKSFSEHLMDVYLLVLAALGMFYSLYLILRRSYRSMFSVVCQQYRMRAKSNNRKIVTTVQMFILKSEALSAVALVAA